MCNLRLPPQLLWALRSLHQRKCGAPSPQPFSVAWFNRTSSDLCRNLQLQGSCSSRGADNRRFVFEACEGNGTLQVLGASANSRWFPVGGSPFTMSKVCFSSLGEGEGDLIGGVTVKPGDSFRKASWPTR